MKLRTPFSFALSCIVLLICVGWSPAQVQGAEGLVQLANGSSTKLCSFSGEDAAAPGEEEDLPEMADIMSDSVFACAPQCPLPNAIGDSLGGSLSISSAFGTIRGYPQGGYTFMATNNNNAIPQDRVYYSYQYFSNAYQVDPAAAGAVDIDLQRHLFGFEKLLIGDIYAIGVQIPVHHQLASDLNANTDPTERATEIGNMTVYSKHVLFQRNNTTISGGFALNLPTGEDLAITAGGDRLRIQNEAVTLTPYLAALVYDPCKCYYYHIFGQFDFALDENEIFVNGARVGQLKDVTLFRLDGSYGRWLRQDCCGNGIVAIAELHFSTTVDGDAELTNGLNTIEYEENRQLNTTLGLGVINHCWSMYPGISLPLLDSPDRTYDWEAQILFERRR